MPTFLRDVERPIDLIEELIRIYGTQHIPDEKPKLPSLPLEDDPSLKVFQKLETYLLAQGFSEAYNYTTVSQGQLLEWQDENAADFLALANPLTQEQTHLRSSLIPGLLKTAQYNLHQKTGRHRFFERGKTFHVLNGKVEERFSLACIRLPKPYKTWQKEELEDFYTVKALLESLLSLAGLKGYHYEVFSQKGYQEGYAARVIASDTRSFFATCGTLHLDLSSAYDLPQALAFEISFSEQSFNAVPACPQFQPFSTFPGITKDLCLIVDSSLRSEEARADMASILHSLCSDDFGLKHLRLFDIFQGKGLPEGQKSLGFEIKFASPIRTLKEAEVNAIFNDLQNKLEALNRYKVRKTT